MTPIMLSGLWWAGASAVVLVMGYYAVLGFTLSREKSKFRKFIGNPNAVAIPPSDMSIRDGTQCAVKDSQDFVVFILGASVHNPMDLKGMSLLMSMPKMLAELSAKPESGFMGGYEFPGNPYCQIQYWRSYDHLIAYARNPKQTHFPTWCKVRNYWSQKAGEGKKPAIGLFHETFKVRAGEYECIYGDLPPFGMGRIMGLVPAKGAYKTSRGRMGDTKGDDVPNYEE